MGGTILSNVDGCLMSTVYLVQPDHNRFTNKLLAPHLSASWLSHTGANNPLSSVSQSCALTSPSPRAQVKGGGGSQEEKECGFGRLFLCLSLARAHRCEGEAAGGDYPRP